MPATLNSTEPCSAAEASGPAGGSLLVFADDWGRHPSSCQHLVRRLLDRHQVYWVNTIGTRTPRLNLATGSEPVGAVGALVGDLIACAEAAPAFGRHDWRSPGFAAVDIRFTRDIRLYRERLGLKLMFEAFNLTNRANFSSITASQYNFSAATKVFTPVATFLLPTATLDPRILQLAVKVTF